MALENTVIPTFAQMLKVLSNWLAKAEAQMSDRAEALLSARLAPGMFPLSTQIRFVCVQAREGLYRLRGEAFPPSIEALLNEGRDAADHPGSIADAQATIDETLMLVEELSSGPFDDDAGRPIEHSLSNGMIFDFTAEEYVRDWNLPQFYFHLMIAYAILRKEGVDLGKADYVAHLFAHLRPGTMPAR